MMLVTACDSCGCYSQVRVCDLIKLTRCAATAWQMTVIYFTTHFFARIFFGKKGRQKESVTVTAAGNVAGNTGLPATMESKVDLQVDTCTYGKPVDRKLPQPLFL